MYKKIILLLLILIFIQGCTEPPTDDEPIIPEPPEDQDEPITDLPDPELPPIDEPDPKNDKPIFPPVFPTPDPEPIDEPPDEPPEDDSFCNTIIDLNDNNVNLGCEDNSGKYLDGCLFNKPTQYSCINNKCTKQEEDTCNECSFCISKDERAHPKLAPERTYYCKPNEFEMGAAAFTCQCPDTNNPGNYITTGASTTLNSFFYNQLVKENCHDNLDNVCNSWREDHACPTWDSTEDTYFACGCYGGSCQFASTYHVTCKINMRDTDPMCTECQEIDEIDKYCVEPPEEDVLLCDFCMENC